MKLSLNPIHLDLKLTVFEHNNVVEEVLSQSNIINRRNDWCVNLVRFDRYSVSKECRSYIANRILQRLDIFLKQQVEGIAVCGFRQGVRHFTDTVSVSPLKNEKEETKDCYNGNLTYHTSIVCSFTFTIDCKEMTDSDWEDEFERMDGKTKYLFCTDYKKYLPSDDNTPDKAMYSRLLKEKASELIAYFDKNYRYGEEVKTASGGGRQIVLSDLQLMPIHETNMKLFFRGLEGLQVGWYSVHTIKDDSRLQELHNEFYELYYKIA